MFETWFEILREGLLQKGVRLPCMIVLLQISFLISDMNENQRKFVFGLHSKANCMFSVFKLFIHNTTGKFSNMTSQKQKTEDIQTGKFIYLFIYLLFIPSHVTDYLNLVND